MNETLWSKNCPLERNEGAKKPVIKCPPRQMIYMYSTNELVSEAQ
jgi:hypothetical protein